jgi:hypothetical protein
LLGADIADPAAILLTASMARILSLSDHHEEVRKLTESYIQSGHLNFLFGSGASMPAISVAGNIEAEINALLAAGNQEDANIRALEFVQDLIDINADLIGKIDNDDIESTLASYVDFISLLDGLLFERKSNLLPRQANLFTTNYDLFFETAASKLATVTMADGFDRSSTLKDFPFAVEKYFDRTYRSSNSNDRLAEVPLLNLIKIHGSLTWKRVAGEIVFNSEIGPAPHVNKNAPAEVAETLSKQALILPNLRKFETTLMERLYFDLLRIFSNSLERDNALLISFGFSFADEHILDITRRALRNATAQLLIFAYSEAAADAFLTKFSQHRNVLILSPGTGPAIDFAAFNRLLREVGPTSSSTA